MRCTVSTASGAFPRVTPLEVVAVIARSLRIRVLSPVSIFGSDSLPWDSGTLLAL